MHVCMLHVLFQFCGKGVVDGPSMVFFCTRLSSSQRQETAEDQGRLGRWKTRKTMKTMKTKEPNEGAKRKSDRATTAETVTGAACCQTMGSEVHAAMPELCQRQQVLACLTATFLGKLRGSTEMMPRKKVGTLADSCSLDI